ncbi:polysaccharide deacetylase family protein [Shewanella bicestrii]
MAINYGVFTISLDFEMYWGVRDKRDIYDYAVNLEGIRPAIAGMLDIFTEFKIHATWATVGFLFFRNYEHLSANLPKAIPTYTDINLSPYEYIKNKKLDERYHFAPDLIQKIISTSGQEVASHTFSHYYCLEDGQTIDQFESDLALALDTASPLGYKLSSLVFPRNQWNSEYLSVLNKYNIKSFRGNELNWMNSASGQEGQSYFKRAARLLDSYINISGFNTHDISTCLQNKPFNFPSSRFLRPYNKKLSFFDCLKLRRIKKAMTHAAKNNELFHLWWHPHNFGAETSKNLDMLREILDHYQYLNKNFGMRSLNMEELSFLEKVYD